MQKLREADAQLATGRSVAQVVPTLGGSEATLNRCRNRYGGIEAEEARRSKEFAIENAPLKRAVADLTVDNPILKGANTFRGKPNRPHNGGVS